MSEWKKVKLGDISLCIQPGPFGTQLHNSDYTDKGVPVIMPKDMIDGRVFHDKLEHGSEDTANRISRHKVDVGDIMVARKGDVRKCIYIRESEEGWITGSDCLKMQLNQKICNSKFIYFQLRSPYIGAWLQQVSKGATMPSLNTLLLSNIEIVLPPIPTQNSIAEILSRYDSLIENYQKQIKLLEEAAQRLYKEWFVDLPFPGHENTKIVDGVPEGWEMKKLIDLVDVQYGFAFDGKLFNSNGEGMPILRIRNIPDGTTSDYTTEEASENYIVHNGDIVVGMDGIFHINSWSGGDAYLVQRACSFRPKEENIRGFIFQAIQEPIKYFEQTLVGATVAHLGKKHIDSIELIVPSNKDFYIPFQKGFKQRQSLLSQIRLLTEARDRLLPKLMSGEIELEGGRPERPLSCQPNGNALGMETETNNRPVGAKD